MNSKEKEFAVDTGTSLHMMSKSDLTPEQQESIQKTKGPSVSMIARVTTHTTEEATVYVCDLDLFVQIQLLTESPAELSLGNLCEESGYSKGWHSRSAMISHREWENIESETDKHITLVFLGVQQTEHQPKISGRADAGTSCGRPRATCGNIIYRMAPTTYGRVDR